MKNTTHDLKESFVYVILLLNRFVEIVNSYV